MILYIRDPEDGPPPSKQVYPTSNMFPGIQCFSNLLPRQNFSLSCAHKNKYLVLPHHLQKILRQSGVKEADTVNLRKTQSSNRNFKERCPQCPPSLPSSDFLFYSQDLHFSDCLWGILIVASHFNALVRSLWLESFGSHIFFYVQILNGNRLAVRESLLYNLMTSTWICFHQTTQFYRSPFFSRTCYTHLSHCLYVSICP